MISRLADRSDAGLGAVPAGAQRGDPAACCATCTPWSATALGAALPEHLAVGGEVRRLLTFPAANRGQHHAEHTSSLSRAAA
jgi:hypothetical protein